VRGLRLILIVDAVALIAGSTISDPIVADVVLFPVLLVGVIVAIACLSADLVPPRRRVDVICSALTIVAPFPFLVLGGSLGPRAAAVAVIALQVIPPIRSGIVRRADATAATVGLRRVMAALVITSILLLIAIVALVWYGSTYLLRPPAATFARGPYLTQLTSTEADFAWQLRSGRSGVAISVLAPSGTVSRAVGGRLTGLTPGTRYLWTADVGGESEAAGAFRTAPLSTATPITLVSFGDYGSGNSHEYAVARLAAAADPSLFLSSGDNAYLLSATPLLNRAIFVPLRGRYGFR